MDNKIILVGSVSDHDSKLVQQAAKVCGMDVEVCSSLSDQISDCAESFPAGYISFIPCTKESLLNIFASQPIGFGDKVSFFQCITSEQVPSFIDDMSISGVFELPLRQSVAYNMVLYIYRNFNLTNLQHQLIQEITRYRKQKFQLIQIGTALSYENNLNRLLELILSVSRDLSGADAGSVYICEKNEQDGTEVRCLRFKVSQNDSVSVKHHEEIVFPINPESISGYVALSGKVLSIDDVDNIKGDVPYRTSKGLGRKFGYKAKSMLTVPLKNMDGEIVGVLQLMNKKKDPIIKGITDLESEVVSFTINDEDIILSIASYAAVSIERVLLYESIEKIFEGFISSSIAAIDERDRVTSGHSKRVMGYAMAFIKAAAEDPQCSFYQLATSPEKIKQFEFAALLHDIGKIGVPEAVLTKECRLSRDAISALISRFEYMKLIFKTKSGNVPWLSVEQIDKDLGLVCQINAAGFLNDENLNILQQLKEKHYRTIDGQQHPVLTDSEFKCLSVRAGNLTLEERKLINSHAMSSYRILSKIPWTRSMEQIPTIACHHHEKVDGTGYPHGLVGEQIPLESRILAAIDIYEALVAQDRPYKPKMPPQKALDILKKEVECEHLDAEVVKFFIDKEIFKLYVDEK